MSEPIKKGKNYYCPFDCGDKRYPKPKWKTEAGAIKHIGKCYMRPELAEKRAAEELNQLLKREDENKELLKTAKYKIGDCVNFLQEYVIKPQYEQRFNRMVRVRYEDECGYRARTQIIKSIGIVSGAVCYNGFIFNKDIRQATIAEIEKEASEKREAHLKWLKSCSDMR